MLIDSKWMAGALAAALLVGPAAAQNASGSGDPGLSPGARGAASTGAGSTTITTTKTDSNDTVSHGAAAAGAAAQGAAHKTADAARGAADSTAAAVDTMGDKASAMGQQATSDAARLLAKLHAGNEMEIHAGKEMAKMAKNAKVKAFAKRMVTDHGAMDKDVKAFAKKAKIDLASAPKPADADKAAMDAKMKEMHAMKGHEAEKAYMQRMVEDHEKDVSEVSDAHQKAQDDHKTELVALLAKTKTKMQAHLDQAKKINDAMK